MYPGPAQQSPTTIIVVTTDPDALNAILSRPTEVPSSGYQYVQGLQSPYPTGLPQQPATQHAPSASVMAPYMQQTKQAQQLSLPWPSMDPYTQQGQYQRMYYQQQLQQLQQQQQLQQPQQTVANTSVIRQSVTGQLPPGYSAAYTMTSPAGDSTLSPVKTPSENEKDDYNSSSW